MELGVRPYYLDNPLQSHDALDFAVQNLGSQLTFSLVSGSARRR